MSGKMLRGSRINVNPPLGVAGEARRVCVCVSEKSIEGRLLTGRSVSTHRTCIEFCHTEFGSCPLGACRDPLGSII